MYIHSDTAFVLSTTHSCRNIAPSGC